MLQTPTNKKKCLLMIFPGPNYDLDNAFGSRLVGLSQHFEGFVLTRTPRPVTSRYGNFAVITTPISGTGSLLSIFIFFSRALFLSLRWRLKGKRIDIVVTYDPLKIGLLGVLLARILNARLVTEVNGDYTSWANYAEVRNPTLRWLKRKLYVATETFVLKRANGIKLLYHQQIDYFRPRLDPRVIETFWDYVDLTRFNNMGEERIVLIAGFPLFVKGVDILIHAFKQLAPKYPDWKLKILGWFPDHTELSAHIAGHPQIFHHEPVHHRDMPQHIGRCAIFVLPSRTEAMGRVLLEAMAAGKPRIGSRVGGIPTLIEDGRDGFLVDAENVEQLAIALDKLMSDSELRRRLGQAGAARARGEFSLEQYFQKLNSFYTKVLESHAAT